MKKIIVVLLCCIPFLLFFIDALVNPGPASTLWRIGAIGSMVLPYMVIISYHPRKD